MEYDGGTFGAAVDVVPDEVLTVGVAHGMRGMAAYASITSICVHATYLMHHKTVLAGMHGINMP